MEEKEEVISSCREGVFEFSRSAELTFTSGAIYDSKAELFSDTPLRFFVKYVYLLRIS